MQFKTTLAAALVATLLSQVAAATSGGSYTETFSGGSNDGSWTFGTPNVMHPTGGNPDDWLGSGTLDTFTPRARTTSGVVSVFHGDYRAQGVDSLGIDLQTVTNQFPTSCQRPLSVQLLSAGTYVYFVSTDNAPCAGTGWASYDFAIPSQSATLPVGWATDPNSVLPPDQIWNDVIQDVEQVVFWYGDPTFFFIFEQWVVGMDNPRISTASSVTYCTAGTSAAGCQATLSASGRSSASAASGFVVSTDDVEGGRNGLFYYGSNGRQANPWGNSSSFQCVVPPVVRTPVQTGTGAPGACNGSMSVDLNAQFAAKPSKNPGAGAVVQTQLWYRDPQNPSNQTTSLSDALEFTVAP